MNASHKLTYSGTYSSHDALATCNANMHMEGPHDITLYIKLHATGNCGFNFSL